MKTTLVEGLPYEGPIHENLQPERALPGTGPPSICDHEGKQEARDKKAGSSSSLENSELTYPRTEGSSPSGSGYLL